MSTKKRTTAFGIDIGGSGIKGALDLVGHSAGPTRLPIQPLLPADRERLTAILAAAGALAG